MSTIVTDTLIIGAGPAGLYAAFTLGLQGIKSCIVDALPHAGGQCAQFFPDKTIYDIPTVLGCSGQELTARLLEQVKPFEPEFYLQQHVTQLSFDSDTSAPLFKATLSDGYTLLANSIIIASGTGAFLPKKIKLEHAELIENKQLFYNPPKNIVDFSDFKDEHILICGDQETALKTACDLATLQQNRPADITLIHRRDQFRASDSSIVQIQQLRAEGRIEFIAGQLTELFFDDETKQLTHASIQKSLTQDIISQPADRIFILQGLSPQQPDFSAWGLEMQGKQLIVDTATYQTNVPGIFAIGDAVTYLGKRQLIVSAFHEATIASYGVASHLQEGASIPLLYTSSSSKLKAVLNRK